MMKKISLVVFILGILVLSLLLNVSPKEVSSLDDLEKFEVNQKVSLSGKIVDERIISNEKRILSLDNKIDVVCECDGSFNGKNVELVGVVSEFNGKKEVEALQISTR